jgi:dTDP-4-dehydrorhamnose 3,5-epimerase
MDARATALDGVLVIEPKVFHDDRGLFFEAWELERYAALGLPSEWRQDNVVHSRRGVLRGMHFQHPNGQHKLVYALEGEIFDVAIDVRRGSPTFGQWVGETLTAENRRQLSVAPGFAHGYLVLSDFAVVAYKCSTRYDPAAERVIRWDDPELAIAWPGRATLVAPRDASARRLGELAPSELPDF